MTCEYSHIYSNIYVYLRIISNAESKIGFSKARSSLCLLTISRSYAFIIPGNKINDPTESSMSTSVATRHPSRSPPLSLSMNVPSLMDPSAIAAAPATPPLISSSMDPESPFYLPPKTSKAEVGRTKSQSRRTLGNWQLGKTIGQGSMGRVRLGHNLTTGEQVSPTFIRLAQ